MSRRNLILRALPILLLLVFLVLSMVFCLIATTSKDWAHFDQPANDKAGKINRTPRSPVYNCMFTQNTRVKQPVCNFRRCIPNVFDDNDYDHLCQLLDISFNLLISANIFLGLACLVGICAGLYAVLKIDTSANTVTSSSPAVVGEMHAKRSPQQHSCSPRCNFISVFSSTLTTSTLILLVAGIPCLLLAHLIGIDAVLNQQFPMGDYITTNQSTKDQPQWMAGVANVYLFISWFSAILALTVLPMVLHLPTVWSSSVKYERVARDEMFTLHHVARGPQPELSMVEHVPVGD